MNLSFVSLIVSLVIVGGLVVSLGFLSLGFGVLEWLLGKPKLKFLKSSRGENGFAFAFAWNEAKEPAAFDGVKLRLFNPFGKPEHLEIEKSFDASKESFNCDLELGQVFESLRSGANSKSTVQVEVTSSKDGLSHQFKMSGEKFLRLLKDADKTVNEMQKEAEESSKPPIQYGLNPADKIAESVPGKGPVLKIDTNPLYVAGFEAGKALGGGGGGAAGEAAGGGAENFSVSKVWIAEGCIVCNACEDIYPEVFDVQADTCLIRPGAPLDNGLLIEEAADACPVEVIKYEKA